MARGLPMLRNRRTIFASVANKATCVQQIPGLPLRIDR